MTPEEFGLERANVTELRGGDAAHNVEITREILGGGTGPRRAVTLLNAGAGLYAANRAASFADGIAIAAEAIDSGRALAKVEELAAFTRMLSASTAAQAASA